jgi:hypothetical protein
MNLSVPLTLLALATSGWAQSPQWFYQPLGQVQQFLQLTDPQLETILANNGDYNQLAMTRQIRISQLQGEIATETGKDVLDPMALGIRYVEIETICRELRDQANTYQQKNASVLTDPQKAKLQALQDAMKLAPVISDAQSGNLIGQATSAPPFFTSSSGATSSGFIGGVLGSVSGCSSPFLPIPVPPNRLSGAASRPQKQEAVSSGSRR